MNLYVGTYSDDTIIQTIKKDRELCLKLGIIEKKFNNDDDRYEDSIKTDEQIKSDYLNKGLIQMGITHYFSKDISSAKQMAIDMGLKNFSQVSNTLYEKGKDY